MSCRDCPGGFFAIAAAPRPPQPIRRIEPSGILTPDTIGALDAQPSQYSVDEPLVGDKTAAVGEIDTGRYGRVRRRPQKQELSDAEPQYVVDHRRAGRQRGAETESDQRVDLAEPPKRGGDKQTGEGTVSPRQLVHRAALVDCVVERAFTAEYRTNQIECSITRSRHLGHQGSSKT